MIRDTIFAALAAFAICAAACPFAIPLLRRLKFGQQVRGDGPQAHLKKQGTPTMGGVVILAAILIPSLFYARTYPRVLPVLFVTAGFGLIGFLDDYTKIVKKHSEGLNPKQKLAAQFAVTGVFAWYVIFRENIGTAVLVPFTGGFENGLWLDLDILYVPFLFFAVLGTDNGVNFTDGLDGLCAGVTIPVAVFFAGVSIAFAAADIAPAAGAAAGSLLGFLLFNAHPAKVFMGDTGSLALGGFTASTALMLGLPLFIPIVGFIYLAEVCSVILQVGYFKATHGKRIFRMAPIHHHFELGGWAETQVTAAFSVVTAVLCLLAALGV